MFVRELLVEFKTTKSNLYFAFSFVSFEGDLVYAFGVLFAKWTNKLQGQEMNVRQEIDIVKYDIIIQALKQRTVNQKLILLHLIFEVYSI